MISTNRRRILVLAMMMVCLASSLFYSFTSVLADASWDRALTARVDADRAIRHIQVLSEKIGPRVSGMRSEKKAAKYIASQLKKHGYRIEKQPFSVPDQYIGHIYLTGKEKWQVGASPEGRVTNKQSVSGYVMYVGKGLSRDDYRADATGKMVLIQYDSADGRNS